MIRSLLFILGGILLFSGKVETTSPEAASAKVKTVFLYNFTKYIDWPKNYKSGNFVIGVLGSNPYLVEELSTMAKTKTAGAQPFEIKNIQSFNKNTKVHMLFINPDYDISMADVEAGLKGKSTLLVTEKPGMAKQSSAINFIVLNNRQKFELNKKNAEKYSLKVSSNLASLAILVE